MNRQLPQQQLSAPRISGLGHVEQPNMPNRQPIAHEGPNPIIMAADPLLSLVTQIKKSKQHPDPSRLRMQLVNEVKLFQKQLNDVRYNTRQITAASYCLCVVLDEAVLKTSWGQNSVWVGQGLLNLFHKENWGGERFYLILKNALQRANENLDLIEFLYLCLSLGYEGQFYQKDKIIREDIRNKVFYRIRRYHNNVITQLSPHWKDAKPVEDKKEKRASIKRLMITSLSFLLIVGFVFNYNLHSYSKSTVVALNKIGNEPPVTMFSQLLDRSIVPHSFD